MSSKAIFFILIVSSSLSSLADFAEKLSSEEYVKNENLCSSKNATACSAIGDYSSDSDRETAKKLL